MEWIDDAIVLSARRYGESAALVMLLSRDHGRHAGLVRGYGGRRNRGVLTPGNGVRARWRGRVADMLGSFTLEPTSAVAAGLLGEPDRLAALAAACAILESALAEREPHPRAFDDLAALVAALASERQWAEAYVIWEVRLLAELGFGLDLTRCAVTGAGGDLAYVSPRTGRAVSLVAAGPWRDRLLALPAFLVAGGAAASDEEVLAGLTLTAHFLQRHVYGALTNGMSRSPSRPPELPPARRLMMDRIAGRVSRAGC
ncbi:MAG: DNA repair protein RecO [Rhodospirillales bacterium]|nr:DNA repair protein RecO [Rhodospirillales bacterium]